MATALLLLCGLVASASKQYSVDISSHEGQALVTQKVWDNSRLGHVPCQGLQHDASALSQHLPAARARPCS